MKKILSLICITLMPFSIFANEKPLVIVQIENANETANDICEIAKTLGMPLEPQMVLGGLGGAVMNPSLAGIDLSQPVQVFIGQPDPNNPAQDRSAFSFAVEGDGSSYIDAVKQVVPTHSLSNGINHFSMPLPNGSSKDFFVSINGSRATAGSAAAALNAFDPTLSPEQKEVMDALPGGVSILVDVPLISDLISKQMEASAEMVEQQQEAMAEMAATNAMPFEMDMAEVMKSYQDMLTLAYAQAEALALSLDLKEGISIYSHLSPKKESTFEKMIAERSAPSATFTAFDSPDALLRFFGSLKGIDYILEPYGKFIGDIYSSMGPPFSEMGDFYTKMMADLGGLYNGGYGFILLPPSEDAPLQLAGIYEISDKERIQKLMDDSMKEFDKVMKANEDNPMGMELKIVGTNIYRGVEITTINMKYELPEAGMPPGYANMFSNMNYLVAYTDQYMLYSLGDEKLMHQTIDHVQKTDHVAPTLSGYEDIQEPIVEYWNIDLAKAISAFSGMMAMPGVESPDLSALSALQTGLSGISYNQNGGVTSLTRIKSEDLAGFMSMGMMMKPKRQAMPPEQAMPLEPAPVN